MRIFSNFNTRFVHKVLAEEHERFDIDDVFVIHRSKYYLLFYVFPRMFGYMGILFFGFFLLSYYQLHISVYSGFFFLWLIVFWFRVMHKFIKYFCDFTVVTPGGITTYKQKGILHSKLKEIPAQRIKAIEISRNNLLGNIFGYGYVDIIADLNEFAKDTDNYTDEAPWVVGLTYVDIPHKIKARISKICFK